MAKEHPYIVPGYAVMAIAPYDVEPTSAPAPAIQSIPDNDSFLAIPPEPCTALMVIPSEPSVEDLVAAQDNEDEADEDLAEPYASIISAENDNRLIRRRMIPAAAATIGIILSVCAYAYSGQDIGRQVASSMAADKASALPVKVNNGIPANMAPMLNVYYQAQPLTTDRVVIEKDAYGCEWRVAFDGSVNIPKGRYPSLNSDNVQKCTDSTRAARPQLMQVARGAEPRGKNGAGLAIVNVIDPATGKTDPVALAALKGSPVETPIDKSAINAIIKSELAKVEKTGTPTAQIWPKRTKVPTTNSAASARYPGSEYRDRSIAGMPSMPGSAGAAGDDKPTYIPYIPGVPYTPPASLDQPSPLRSIKPKVSGGVVKREMVPQIQSARPGGDPTELRQPLSAPQQGFPADANGIPNGNPLG